MIVSLVFRINAAVAQVDACPVWFHARVVHETDGLFNMLVCRLPIERYSGVGAGLVDMVLHDGNRDAQTLTPNPNDVRAPPF